MERQRSQLERHPNQLERWRSQMERWRILIHLMDITKHGFIESAQNGTQTKSQTAPKWRHARQHITLYARKPMQKAYNELASNMSQQMLANAGLETHNYVLQYPPAQNATQLNQVAAVCAPLGASGFCVALSTCDARPIGP